MPRNSFWKVTPSPKAKEGEEEMTVLTIDQQSADAQPGDMNKFLVVWLGQVISMLGSGLTAFALGVWIFQKTGQATPFALTILFSTLPAHCRHQKRSSQGGDSTYLQVSQPAAGAECEVKWKTE